MKSKQIIQQHTDCFDYRIERLDQPEPNQCIDITTSWYIKWDRRKWFLM